MRHIRQTMSSACAPIAKAKKAARGVFKNTLEWVSSGQCYTMEKGISFSLGGSKRSASGRPRAAPPAAGGVVKKPGPVVDIFAEESDEEGRGVEEVPQEESCKKARRELSGPPVTAQPGPDCAWCLSALLLASLLC